MYDAALKSFLFNKMAANIDFIMKRIIDTNILAFPIVDPIISASLPNILLSYCAITLQ